MIQIEESNPSFESCSACIHSDDSEEICILRRCIHAVAQLKECYVPKQPTIGPQQRWIPCSERLPEPRVAVLGYAPKFKNIFALYYDSVMGWMVWSPIRDDCLPNSQGDIIAWMPLPEPYAERRTDE